MNGNEKEVKKEKLTSVTGAPVPDNQNAVTAGPRGPMLLQDVWFLEKLAHGGFDEMRKGHAVRFAFLCFCRATAFCLGTAANARAIHRMVG